MEVVIDTNVIVSGLRSTLGASFKVLRAVRVGQVSPVVSVPLFLEYEDVLLRPNLLPAGMTAPAISAFLDAFLSLSKTQEIHFRWRPSLPDPQDECVLETSIAAGCIPIVTNNHRDFRPASQFGIRVLSPSELIHQLNLT